MLKFKRNLAIIGASIAIAATGAVASPQSASAIQTSDGAISAGSVWGPQVCLEARSAYFAYLIGYYPDGKRYVNRGKCSVRPPMLQQFGVANGFWCKDQYGDRFFAGFRYQASFYDGSKLTCNIA